MTIDSDKIAAFVQLAADGNFSKAARSLHLSQPALSKKIRRLEDELGVALAVRNRKGVTLTDVGREVVRYARTLQLLDHELRQSIQDSSAGKAAGDLKIAAYSSITRSAVLPCLKDVLKGALSAHVDLMSRELHELPDLLLRGNADIILTTEPIVRDNIAMVSLGTEEFIHIRPAAIASSEVQLLPFLDHDADDQVTMQFLDGQGLSRHVLRSFYDDIYLILDAVRMGLGQAVVSRHLVKAGREFAIVRHKKKIRVEIFAQYFKNSYQPRIHKQVMDALNWDLRKYTEVS